MDSIDFSLAYLNAIHLFQELHGYMGEVKNILIIYTAFGILYIALLASNFIDRDANPWINILYFVFIPFALLYFVLQSIWYGIFGAPVGTL